MNSLQSNRSRRITICLMKPLLPLRAALLLLSLLLPLALHATLPPEPDAVQQGLALGLWEQPAGWGKGRLGGLKVPMLRGDFKERWGDSAVFTTTPDGSYVMLYANPKNPAEFVKIIGTTRKVVPVGKASGRNAYDAGIVTILGRAVRTLACGNETPEIMTEPFTLTKALFERRTGTFVVRAGGTKAEIKRNLAAVGW